MKKCFLLILSLTLCFSLCSCKNDIKSITLNRNTISIGLGETFTLTATILPGNADDIELAWTIDGEAVDAVTDENTMKKEFTAINTGKSLIKVLASDGHSDECEVNVEMDSSNISERKEIEESEKVETHEEINKEAKTTGYLIDGRVKVKLKNSMPATIREYSFADGSVYRTYEITKVKVDGNAVYVSGTKTSDRSGNQFGCKIKWELYDDTGAVVDSDWTLSPSTGVGESWANVNIRFNPTSLPSGEYVLAFCDSE